MGSDAPGRRVFGVLVMADIVKRLRQPIDLDDPDLWKIDRDRLEAADEIERMRAHDAGAGRRDRAPCVMAEYDPEKALDPEVVRSTASFIVNAFYDHWLEPTDRPDQLQVTKKGIEGIRKLLRQ